MARKRRARREFPWPLALIGVGIVLLSLTVVLAIRPRATASSSTPQPASQHSDEETFPEIPRVTVAEAKQMLDSGEAIFVDVRDASAFAQGHIPGAVSIPLGELEARLTELDPSQWIITYCT